MTVTAKPNLRMRENPTITATALAFPKYGETVEFLGEVGEEEIHDRVRGKWNKIKYKGQQGYVFGGFLKELSGTKSKITERGEQAKRAPSKLRTQFNIDPVFLFLMMPLVYMALLLLGSFLYIRYRVQVARNSMGKISGKVMGSKKRSDTYVSGSGSSNQHGTSVSISSQVVVEQEFFLKKADGTEQAVQLSDNDIPVRDGQTVTMVHACGRWIRLVNHNANNFWRISKGKTLASDIGAAPSNRRRSLIGGLLFVLALSGCVVRNQYSVVGTYLLAWFWLHFLMAWLVVSRKLDPFFDQESQKQLSRARKATK